MKNLLIFFFLLFSVSTTEIFAYSKAELIEKSQFAKRLVSEYDISRGDTVIFCFEKATFPRIVKNTNLSLVDLLTDLHGYNDKSPAGEFVKITVSGGVEIKSKQSASVLDPAKIITTASSDAEHITKLISGFITYLKAFISTIWVSIVGDRLYLPNILVLMLFILMLFIFIRDKAYRKRVLSNLIPDVKKVTKVLIAFFAVVIKKPKWNIAIMLMFIFYSWLLFVTTFGWFIKIVIWCVGTYMTWRLIHYNDSSVSSESA